MRFFLFILLLLSPSLAIAQDSDPFSFITSSKELKHTYSGKIDKVIDGQTLLLTNDKIVRLVGLDIPAFQQSPDFDFSLKAKMLLTEMLPKGTDVMIYQTRMAKKGRVNRMGHDLGHILTKESKDKPPQWLQGVLLAKGLARVYTSSSNPELAQEMLSLEHKAISAKTGLWSDDSPFKMLSPDTAKQGMGNFTIVEGAVTKTATVKNTLYLNFGQDWKTDFTIMISSSLRKELARRPLDLMNLGGKTVRVRGWLRDYNGPLIELEDAGHLEILTTSPLQAPTKETNLP
jgi:endonuclease YncB( thermonuclease family)